MLAQCLTQTREPLSLKSAVFDSLLAYQNRIIADLFISILVNDILENTGSLGIMKLKRFPCWNFNQSR